MDKCPFKAGDWVVYRPCEHGYGWDLGNPLAIGYAYKVIAIHDGGLEVDGYPRSECCTHWSEFQNLPDFYLATYERNGKKRTRACRFAKRVKTKQRDDWMLVAIDPPIAGYTRYETDAAMIIPLDTGKSLFPVKDYPMPVRVALVTVISPTKLSDVIQEDEYMFMPFNMAELYKTREEADNALRIAPEALYPKTHVDWYWKLRGY